MSIRRPVVAGNWKMNNTVAESLALVRELRRLLSPVRHCDVIVAPPYTALYPVAQRLEDSNIMLSAQELYFENSGAYTGAISAAMLSEVGCGYVLVGHSERRQIFHETLGTVNLRLNAALSAQLKPILCIGETLEERETGRTMAVLDEQIDSAIAGFSADVLCSFVLAYEPVWAIGTGKVASTQQAQEAHAHIRERLHGHIGQDAEAVRILYGGSVKPDNAAELMAQPDIDGALVGGASLSADSFAAIVAAAVPKKG